ncbi:hypothetical protein AT6N2_C0616 [Agrobacterium tumefaciens]|nr:hypothetical protein AT6N2_C0616 [Agrobacterium tumefaciens]
MPSGPLCAVDSGAKQRRWPTSTVKIAPGSRFWDHYSPDEAHKDRPGLFAAMVARDFHDRW